VLLLAVVYTGWAQNTGFHEEGIASWYGVEYAGRRTASGEVFDADLFTAAHPTLAFGTMLVITNKHNNKQVVVRVNDRGPFKSARILDVSQAAAEQLDMIVTGTAPVIAEILGPAAQTPEFRPSQQTALARPASSPVPTSAGTFQVKPAIPPGGTGKQYRIQIGAYRNMKNAADVFDRLKLAGFSPNYEHVDDIYRVVLAMVNTDDIPAVVEKLSGAGFREALIREEFF
jgi:rare lipoprotein A